MRDRDPQGRVPVAHGHRAAAVAMRGITKRFPGIVANDDVTFEVAPGEVHALLGENGAGKTTLMNVLTGLYRPDAGTIEVGGQPVELHSPRDAIDAGIGMVHQHFRLVETLTVADNIALSATDGPFVLRRRDSVRQVQLIAEGLHLPIDPDARIPMPSLEDATAIASAVEDALHEGGTPTSTAGGWPSPGASPAGAEPESPAPPCDPAGRPTRDG